MKKMLLIAAVILLAVSKLFAQGTYVVNNTPGSAANYHILQHALDSVPAGSIILLQNSGLNYGSAYIKKPVVIYGAGYFLGQNQAPATQATMAESMINYLEFDSGSKGSIVTGLHIRDSSNDQNIVNSRLNFGNTSNITVSRCLVEPAVATSYNYSGNMTGFGNCSNITIEQCYFDLQNVSPYLIGINNSTGITFNNNLIIGYVNFSTSGNGNNVSYSLINNTFYGYMPGAFFASGCQLLQNNIIIVTDTATNSTSSNGLYNGPFSFATHNITNVKQLFSSDNNADKTNLIDANLSIDSLFLDFSIPSISSTDGNYELRANTVGKNFGNDGTDAGAYGGATPYKLSGIPAIPNIYFAQVPQTGTSGGGLKVHLKVQANN